VGDISTGVLLRVDHMADCCDVLKQFAMAVDVIDCDEPRLCAITIRTWKGPVLFMNVYMPTDARGDNFLVSLLIFL